MAGEGALGCHGGVCGIAGTRKNDEEGITLRIDLMAVMLLERCTQKRSALSQHICVALTELLE